MAGIEHTARDARAFADAMHATRAEPRLSRVREESGLA